MRSPAPYLLGLWLAACVPGSFGAPAKPNIILLFADDISARELPIYGSSKWTPPTGGDSTDPQYRAQTPVLDRLAREGCFVRTAWAAVVCSPSRAMMMTGRYAHLHKWWENKDKGVYQDARGRFVTWPLYESSPLIIGHVAQKGGYGTYWAGKTQMAGDLTRFGFDEGCFTPGEGTGPEDTDNSFKLVAKKSGSSQTLVNVDTGKVVEGYAQSSWYWRPHVSLMNDPSAPGKMVIWPNSAEAKKEYGVHTYGPDVELDYIFRYMERQKAAGKPFFIYHTSHLGHDAFNWINPNSGSKWPSTPIVKWDGQRYTRTAPRITGARGSYDTHGTVTGPGIHHHINYLDYQVWLYLNKLRELGLEQNTLFIFCADNGTWGYGKASPISQRGTHVPLIIYAPWQTKHGEQDVLVNMSDMLPTIADLGGFRLPADYEINGESLVPFLFGDKPVHRDWLYAYKGPMQIIRGSHLLRDGHGKWWDVSARPADLISFPRIDDWSAVSDVHRAERKKLEAILPRFNKHETEPNKPGVVVPPGFKPRGGGEG